MSAPATSTPISAVAPVSEIRSRFPALERTENGAPVAYFDGPGGTQVPRAVADAMADYLLRHNANTHWAYPTSVETDAMIASSRRALADFLGGDPSEIVFGANMTTLTFHLGRALARGWASGDEVVVTDLDHHANVDPWRALEKDRGIVVKAAPLAAGEARLDLDALGRLLGKRTRLVAVGGASNAVGTINDVARVASMAHANGSLVFVDAVHYAPHALVDVKALGTDFLACSPYKFYGPHAGVLWGRRHLLEALDAPKLAPAPSEAPDRLETGTQNHEGIAGCGAAVDFLASLAGETGDRRARLARTFAALHGRGEALLSRMWTGLGAIPGVNALRAAARIRADADDRVRGEGPRLGGRRARARAARRLRLARRLLRDDPRRAPRPRGRRPRPRRRGLLHDGGRGGPARRRRRGRSRGAERPKP